MTLTWWWFAFAVNEERTKREENKRLGLVFRVILKNVIRMRSAELDEKGPTAGEACEE
jgi:hypothetical protein